MTKKASRTKGAKGKANKPAKPSKPVKKKSIFFWAAVAGIFTAVLFIPQLAIEIMRVAGIEGGNSAYIVLSIITTITYAVFVWGFKELGDRTGNSMLSWSSCVLIAMGIISEIYVMVTLASNSVDFLAYIILVLTGLAGMVFGFALLKLKSRFGNIATATAILAIGEGAATASILFVVIAVLLFIPVYILEIILLFRADKKL